MKKKNDYKLTLKQNLKSALNDSYKEDSSEAYIQSRTKWLEKSKKSSSYFLNLEKQHQSCVVKFVNDEGDVASTDTEILNQLKTFNSKNNHILFPNMILNPVWA